MPSGGSTSKRFKRTHIRMIVRAFRNEITTTTKKKLVEQNMLRKKKRKRVECTHDDSCVHWWWYCYSCCCCCWWWSCWSRRCWRLYRSGSGSWRWRWRQGRVTGHRKWVCLGRKRVVELKNGVRGFEMEWGRRCGLWLRRLRRNWTTHLNTSGENKQIVPISFVLN